MKIIIVLTILAVVAVAALALIPPRTEVRPAAQPMAAGRQPGPGVKPPAAPAHLMRARAEGGTAGAPSDGGADPSPRAAEGSWTEDVAAAMARATAEKKDILYNFTGSDWCPGCIQLKDAVLETAEFVEAAEKRYVLVLIDFPRRREQPEEMMRRNDELFGEHGCEGYPSLILADARGRAYALVVRPSHQPQEFLEQLREAEMNREQRDALFAAAHGTIGPERAQRLDEVLSFLGERGAFGGYGAEHAEVLALDPDNALGLAAKYQGMAIAREMSGFIRRYDMPGAQAYLERQLARGDIPVPTRQRLMINKASMVYSEDREGGIALFKQAQALAPDTAEGGIAARALAEIGGGP